MKRKFIAAVFLTVTLFGMNVFADTISDKEAELKAQLEQIEKVTHF